MATKRIEGFTRRGLAKKFRELGFTQGVEVGVCRGKFSQILCDQNPELSLVGVDPYDTVELRGARIGAERQNEFFNEATERMKPYKYKLIRKSSMEAVLEFPFESLDFVYIDAGHEFDYVMCDIIEWARRVKKGGIISGHDYYRFVNSGVIAAVDTYAKIHHVNPVYLTGEPNDRRSSWWFEKTW